MTNKEKSILIINRLNSESFYEEDFENIFEVIKRDLKLDKKLIDTIIFALIKSEKLAKGKKGDFKLVDDNKYAKSFIDIFDSKLSSEDILKFKLLFNNGHYGFEEYKNSLSADHLLNILTSLFEKYKILEVNLTDAIIEDKYMEDLTYLFLTIKKKDISIKKFKRIFDVIHKEYLAYEKRKLSFFPTGDIVITIFKALIEVNNDKAIILFLQSIFSKQLSIGNLYTFRAMGYFKRTDSKNVFNYYVKLLERENILILFLKNGSIKPLSTNKSYQKEISLYKKFISNKQKKMMFKKIFENKIEMVECVQLLRFLDKRQLGTISIGIRGYNLKDEISIRDEISIIFKERYEKK